MNDLLKEFSLAFIPLFVAIDVIGITPIFLSLSGQMTETTRRRVINTSVLTALIIAVVFMFSGSKIFQFMGITQDDFRVGGGILLFLIALSDILHSNIEERRQVSDDIAIVPMAIPLILGPGALAAVIILASQFSVWIVLAAIFCNLALVWLGLRFSTLIRRLLGSGGTKALGKIFSLLLLAYAVMMVRVGIKGFLADF
jgi:multiple antibiotic resistance protein